MKFRQTFFTDSLSVYSGLHLAMDQAESLMDVIRTLPCRTTFLAPGISYAQRIRLKTGVFFMQLSQS